MAGIRTEIARWTREGVSLELIGERIGGLPESDDDKSALWLCAWSCRRSHGHGVPDGDSRRKVLAD